MGDLVDLSERRARKLKRDRAPLISPRVTASPSDSTVYWSASSAAELMKPEALRRAIEAIAARPPYDGRTA